MKRYVACKPRRGSTSNHIRVRLAALDPPYLIPKRAKPRKRAMAKSIAGRGPEPAHAAGSVGYVYLLACVAALGGLLFGYDTAIISGAIGFLTTCFDLDPAFEKGWAASSVLLGCAAGAAVAGALSDRLGRKKMLILAGIFFLVSALGTALPQSVRVFVVFRIVTGLAIGAASISSPMYIAEISPARMRGKMVSINQFAIVAGILVAYFVNYSIAAHGNAIDRAVVWHDAESQGSVLGRNGNFFKTGTVPETSHADPGKTRQSSQGDRPRFAVPKGWNATQGWRWMFGLGACPALLFLGMLLVVPESPRWLTKQGRTKEAMATLVRVNGDDVARAELAAIEQAIATESSSLGQLIQPGMRVALVIGITLAVLQQITGINVFLYFAPEIFKKMGSAVGVALFNTVIVGAVNMAFTLVAIRTVDWLGRKPLMLIGSAGMGISLLGMGAAAYWQRADAWVLTLMLSYIACFALSVGPVTWVILSEIFPTQIRGRAMAIATVCLWLADFVVTQTFPMMDENAWLIGLFHRGFPFLLYAFFCAVSVLFVWRFVPETKGKTLEEIERSWTR
ncbi:MAG: sugar porter family MFS transporter [Thermoguttaceae bacterium]